VVLDEDLMWLPCLLSFTLDLLQNMIEKPHQELMGIMVVIVVELLIQLFDLGHQLLGVDAPLVLLGRDHLVEQVLDFLSE